MSREERKFLEVEIRRKKINIHQTLGIDAQGKVFSEDTVRTQRISDRLRRAIYRSIIHHVDHSATPDNMREVKQRIFRILNHAEKLGWIDNPCSVLRSKW